MISQCLLNEKSSKEKILIVAFPSVGLVGAFATSYIVNQLKMKNIGELDFIEISPSFVIRNGEVHGLGQIYSLDNIFAILAGIPLNAVLAYEFLKKSIDFAKKNGIQKIIIPRGLELAGNLKTNPVTYGLAVTSVSQGLLKEYGLPIIPQATILGTDAGVISALKKTETPSLVLYTTSRPMFPDADAIVKAVETLAGIIDVKVDVEKFEEQLERISEQNERMIDETKRHFEKLSEKPAAMSNPGIG